MLYLAEASRRFGCTEIFKEPSKFAWSDYYEEHFIVPYQRIVLVTSKRVMLLQVNKGIFNMCIFTNQIYKCKNCDAISFVWVCSAWISITWIRDLARSCGMCPGKS